MVDPLAEGMWECISQLRTVFANPGILKVRAVSLLKRAIGTRLWRHNRELLNTFTTVCVRYLSAGVLDAPREFSSFHEAAIGRVKSW